MQVRVLWFSAGEDLVQQLVLPRQLDPQVSPCHVVQTTGNLSRCIYSVWWLQMRQPTPQAEICKLALRAEKEASPIIPRTTGRQKLKPWYFQSVTSTSPHWQKHEIRPSKQPKSQGIFSGSLWLSILKYPRDFGVTSFKCPTRYNDTKIHAYSSWSCAWTKHCLLLSLKLQLWSAPICTKFDCFPGISPIRR